MKLIIAGSRNFSDYSLLKKKMDHFLMNVKEKVEIVSGTAKGADSLGERYANEMGYTVKKFPADWEKHGRKAGHLRNREMAEYATHCVCFWDGVSKGTKGMIDLCKMKGIESRIVRFT